MLLSSFSQGSCSGTLDGGQPRHWELDKSQRVILCPLVFRWMLLMEKPAFFMPPNDSTNHQTAFGDINLHLPYLEQKARKKGLKSAPIICQNQTKLLYISTRKMKLLQTRSAWLVIECYFNFGGKKRWAKQMHYAFWETLLVEGLARVQC